MCSSAVRRSAGSTQWVFIAFLLKQLCADEENDTMRTVRMNQNHKVANQIAYLWSSTAFRSGRHLFISDIPIPIDPS